MEKFGHMRSFTNAACEYTKQPNEVTATLIQRNLGVISKSVDKSIFDPDSMITTEFYAALYELLHNANSDSVFTWVALDVLQTACRNIAARHALIHSYKFAPTLVSFLKPCSIDCIDSQKQEQVLTLLEEFTSGIQISWQEVHLSYLITTLAQWVQESKEHKLVSLSLGVLVNICFKNMPAIYTFMRSVDSKKFTRHLLKLNSANIDTRVQCVKFLLTMENLSKDVTDKIARDYVDLVFESIISALKNRDATCLRHSVDFFINFKDDTRCYDSLLKYPSYRTDVEKMIAYLQNTSDVECIGLIIEFLLSLLKNKLADLSSLHAKLVKEAMKWIPVNQVCSKSLALIKTVLKDEDLSESITDSTSSSISFHPLENVDISVLLLASTVDDEMMEKKKTLSGETIERFSELLQVLQVLIKNRNLRNQIVQHFNLKLIQTMLNPVLKFKEQGTKDDKFNDNLYGSLSSMFVHALSLIADLSAHQSDWAVFHNELLQMKQVYLMLAHALFIGDSVVKEKIFRLGADQNFCTSNMIECMKELEPSLLLQGTATNVFLPTLVDHLSLENGGLLSVNHKERIDYLLEKLNNACQSDQVADNTSAIMELYEYQLASMRYSGRALEKSLEVCNNHNAVLQQRLVQMNTASDRSRSLLFHSQQCLEGVKKEKTDLLKKMGAMESDIKKIHAQYKKQQVDQHEKHLQQLAEKDAVILQQQEEIKQFSAIKDTIFKAFQSKGNAS